MCGIFLSSSSKYSTLEKIKVAKKSLRNRGPDNHKFVRFENGLTLLHTRLAIQDETLAGSQPMFSILVCVECWGGGGTIMYA